MCFLRDKKTKRRYCSSHMPHKDYSECHKFLRVATLAAGNVMMSIEHITQAITMFNYLSELCGCVEESSVERGGTKTRSPKTEPIILGVDV